MLFSEAIEEYIKWRSFKRRKRTTEGDELQLKYFCIHIRNCHIENIELGMIIEWLELMRDLDFDSNTIGKKSTALRMFFDFYLKQNYQVIDPMLIPVPPRKYRFPRVTNDEQYEQLLSIIPEKHNHLRNKAMITMLWDTGARVGEVCSLDVGDVSVENKKAIIQSEKSRGTRPIRELFWTNTTNDLLVRYLEYREYVQKRVVLAEPEALFVSIRGGQHNGAAGRRTPPGVIGEILRKYSNKAGLAMPVNAHSMRHHMGHNIIRKGGSNADVMNILGHTSVQSTTVYTMMKDRELEKRYRKFNGQ